MHDATTAFEDLLKAPVDADPAPQGQRPPAQARTACRGRSSPARGSAGAGSKLVAAVGHFESRRRVCFAILLQRWLLAFCAMSLDDSLDGASETGLFLVPPRRAGPAREQVVRRCFGATGHPAYQSPARRRRPGRPRRSLPETSPPGRQLINRRGSYTRLATEGQLGSLRIGARAARLRPSSHALCARTPRARCP